MTVPKSTGMSNYNAFAPGAVSPSTLPPSIYTTPSTIAPPVTPITGTFSGGSPYTTPISTGTYWSTP